jgi:hypothetical protein
MSYDNWKLANDRDDLWNHDPDDRDLSNYDYTRRLMEAVNDTVARFVRKLAANAESYHTGQFTYEEFAASNRETWATIELAELHDEVLYALERLDGGACS